MLNGLLTPHGGSIGKLCASSSTPLRVILERNDLASYLKSSRDGQKNGTAVFGFVERFFSELLGVAFSTNINPISSHKVGQKLVHPKSRDETITQKDNTLLHMTNATELIIFYMSCCQDPTYTIDIIVPSVIGVLRIKECLSLTMAQCLRCVILEAFKLSPMMTAGAIAVSLDEETVHGTIRAVSSNFIIAELIVAIFGSALRPQDMVSPAIKTSMFTEAWLRFNFPEYLVSHISIALTSRDYDSYFYFFKELLKRGFSHSAGPIIDAILRYQVVSGLFNAVLEACEGEENYPILSQGVEIIHSVIALVRKSLMSPDTKEMYRANVTLISPIKWMQLHAQRLCNLLVVKTKIAENDDASKLTRHLDLVQFWVCEIFVELLRFFLHDTDKIVVESGFLDKIVELCASYPESNRLGLSLRHAFEAIFLRPTLRGGSKVSICSGFNGPNVVLEYIIEHETDIGQDSGFLSRTVKLCTDESLRCTSLSAFLIDKYNTLADTELFREPSGPLRHVIWPLFTDATILKRVNDMKRTITGQKFHAVGSAALPPVRHRPVIDYKAECLVRGNLSLSPSSGEKGDALTPTRINMRANSYITEGENDTNQSSEQNPPVQDGAFSALDALLVDGEGAVTLESAWGEKSFQKPISPQVRAYPNFCDMHMSFEVRDGGAINYQIKDTENEQN